ncbi:MAG: autotransporter-associated beta strand repeat-containing protein, partial [Burkholderiales bacterium]|nr:autotransporter-associated beta strand repeat-containing protein [Phycisphaerae bacterium]
GGQNINALNGTGGTIDAAGARTLTLGNGDATGSFAGVIQGPVSLTKTGAGTQTLTGVNTYTGTTTISGGKLLFTQAMKNAAPVVISNNAILEVAPNGLAPGVSKVKSIAITTDGLGGYAGRFELHDNDLVIDYTGAASPYTTTLDMVRKGLVLLGGNGKGIGSAEVDAQTLGGTMLAVVDNGAVAGVITALSGYANIPGQAVLVKYTWRGDANLDGVVNGSDYALADTGFTGGGTGWFYGDVNYDGITNGSDYALLDTGFTSQSGTLPEPGAVGILGMAACILARRRRNRSPR